MILHGTVLSPYVRKVRALLHEKGLDFETRELTPAHDGDRLRAMHPLGKIPVLEHDGVFVPDSSVICAYLERLQPEPRLYPEAPTLLARALFLEEWSDTRGLEVFHPAWVERGIVPRLFSGEPDEARIRRVREEVAPPNFDWLESQLDGGPYAVGGTFSIADCALGAQLQSWAWAGEAIDAGRWPALRAYADQAVAGPAFAALGSAIASG